MSSNAWQPTLDADRPGQVVILDRGADREKRYRTVTVGDEGASAITGWCKTLSYCEKRHDEQVSEGWDPVGVVPMDSVPEDLSLVLRMSPFRDSDLKSALQKYVRRGYEQEAARVAWTMLSDNRWWVMARTSIIAAEDVGPSWLPLAWSTYDFDLAESSVARRLAALALAERKGRESCWLEMCVWPVSPDQFHEVSFRSALAKGDPEEAAVHALAGMGQDAVWHALLDACSTEAQERVTAACFRRVELGARGGNERILYLIPVLAICDGLDTLPEVELPEVDLSVVEDLEWWAVDAHSASGAGGLKRASRRLKVPYDRLTSAMFWCETRRLVPETEVRWQEHALEAKAREKGFETYDAFVEFWLSSRGIVKAMIRQVLDEQR